MQKVNILCIEAGLTAQGWVPRESVDVIHTVETLAAATEEVQTSAYDVVLAFTPVGQWTAEQVVRQIHNVDALVPVVIVEEVPTIERALHIARMGAFDYVSREMGREAVCAALQAAVRFRRAQYGVSVGGGAGTPVWRRNLVGSSQPMLNLERLIKLVGPRRCTVLITGETGTGKEVVARSIHMASGRAQRPFVALNCHAVPESLLEAELFGHEKGAFTGATSTRIGCFERAHTSTLFLDEIGDMAIGLQAKLLRVLQEREFQRVGSSETLRVDVRVIAATNVDLLSRVKAGAFREDLYYRLNVVPLCTPPLRERRDDIPALVSCFMRRIAARECIPAKIITPEVIQHLRGYDWPGNVRQLENAIEMALVLSGDRELLYTSDFPVATARTEARLALSSTPILPRWGLDLERTIGSLERSLIDQALKRTNGNKKAAADLLQLKRTTLTAKLKTFARSVETAAAASA